MSVRSALGLVLVLALGSTGCLTSIGVRQQEDKILKPSSYVAIGNFRAESAASKEFPEEKRREYRLDARNSFLKALEVDPRSVQAQIGLVRLEFAAGDPASAEAAFQKVVALGGADAALWGDLAQFQAKHKQWTAAAASYRKVSELDPQNRHAQASLAAVLLMAGQKPEAFAVLTRIHGEARACVELARAVARLNSPQEAAMLLARAEQLDPHSPELRQVKADLSTARDAGIVQAGYQAPASAAAPGAGPGPGPEILNGSMQNAPVRMPPRPVLSIRSVK